MKAVFLAPSYPPEMQQYTRGLAEIGVEVYGVGDTPVGALPASLKPHLADYLQVPRILDDDDVVARVTAWMRGRSVDRVLANWEVMVQTAARLRERFGVHGMSVDTVEGFRHAKLPVFSVQYHPEASPGPHDAAYLFDAFIEMIKTRKPPTKERLKELQSMRDKGGAGR